MLTDRVLYRSGIGDNRRWDALELREGDIIISAPSKCGVTWTQRLVSLLVFDGPELPGPLSTVSPWLDRTVLPIDQVVAGLKVQRHRRFIKTHTPLDGLVLDSRVTYIGVGRDPRDAAMSELAQWDNMNHVDGPGDHDPSPVRAFQAWMEGPIMPPEHPGGPPGGMGPMGPVGPGGPGGPLMQGPPPVGPPPPAKHMGSLANILHHFGTMWARRQLPNVAMLHYADMRADLVGEFLRLARVLGFEMDAARAAELTRYATLDSMRARASELAPESTEGIWRSNAGFFRSGGQGEWQGFFDERVYRRYYDRINQLAPPDLLAWAHEGRADHDPD